jgi:hypothetical protein
MVVVAGQILPADFNYPRFGTLNICGPAAQVRGAAPIAHAILNSETKTQERRSRGSTKAWTPEVRQRSCP